MNRFVEMLSASWPLMGFVKVGTVAAIAGVLLRGIRQRRLSSALWAVFMILLPLVFFSGLLPVSWRVLPATPHAPPPPRLVATEPGAAVVAGPNEPNVSSAVPSIAITEGVEKEESAGPPEMRQAALLSRNQWLLLIWAAGAAVSLGPALLSLFAARRLPQEPAPAEIRGRWEKLAGAAWARVPVHLSSTVPGPGVNGLFRPVVVLPVSAPGWSEEQLECVLRHEFQHLRSHDLAVRWLGRIARALLWFHPAAWWGQYRLELAQEQAADEGVVKEGVATATYAGHLLAMASEGRCFPGIAMARQSQVGGRIRLLLSRRDPVGRASPDISHGA